MKKMIAGMIIILSLCMTGCHKEPPLESTDFLSENEAFYGTVMAESEKGYYLVEERDERDVLSFADRESSKKTVLCQNLNCKHDSEECEAVAGDDKSISNVIYTDGKVYTLEADYRLNEGLTLYEREPNGDNKKKIHQFQQISVYPCQVAIYKGKLFVTSQVMRELEDGTGASAAEPSLVMYDLKTKEEKIIVDGLQMEGIYTTVCAYDEDCLYIAQYDINGRDNADANLMKYDLKNDTWEELMKIKICEVQIIKDDIVYLQNRKERKIEAFNLKTKEKKEIFEWDKDAKRINVIQGFVRLENSDGELNWYDLDEKKYLFDSYQKKSNIYYKGKRGYVGRKEKSYAIYHLNKHKWQEFQEIK